jgi:hypothetical protein
MMTFQSPQAGRTVCGESWHVRANSIPPLLRREKIYGVKERGSSLREKDDVSQK